MPDVSIFHHDPCPILVFSSELTFNWDRRDVDPALEIEVSVRHSDITFISLQCIILK